MRRAPKVNEAYFIRRGHCCHCCADDSESEEICAEIRTVNNLSDSELRAQLEKSNDLRAPRPAFRVRRARKVNETYFI